MDKKWISWTLYDDEVVKKRWSLFNVVKKKQTVILIDEFKENKYMKVHKCCDNWSNKIAYEWSIICALVLYLNCNKTN